MITVTFFNIKLIQAQINFYKLNKNKKHEFCHLFQIFQVFCFYANTLVSIFFIFKNTYKIFLPKSQK